MKEHYRQIALKALRDVLIQIDNASLTQYVAYAPVNVEDSAQSFGALFGYPRKWTNNLIFCNISVPYEMNQILRERGVEQLNKGAKAQETKYMPRSGKINKIKFYSIARDVRESVQAESFNAKTVAEKHHVSRETVNAIKRAKTWPGFVLAKQSKNTMIASRKADKFDKIVSNEMKVQRLIDKIAESPITRAEFEGLYRAVGSLRRRVEEVEGTPAKKRTWFGR